MVKTGVLYNLIDRAGGILPLCFCAGPACILQGKAPPLTTIAKGGAFLQISSFMGGYMRTRWPGMLPGR